MREPILHLFNLVCKHPRTFTVLGISTAHLTSTLMLKAVGANPEDPLPPCMMRTPELKKP